MSSRSSGNTRLYIGNVSRRTRQRDLEDPFRRFGRIRDVDLKTDYGFIEFYDARDAEDALRDMHRRTIDGSKIVVEWAG
jgi:arginine/serine-rich splicing factor 7